VYSKDCLEKRHSYKISVQIDYTLIHLDIVLDLTVDIRPNSIEVTHKGLILVFYKIWIVFGLLAQFIVSAPHGHSKQLLQYQSCKIDNVSAKCIIYIKKSVLFPLSYLRIIQQN
jgi:hypothetical protein